MAEGTDEAIGNNVWAQEGERNSGNGTSAHDYFLICILNIYIFDIMIFPAL